MSLDTRPLADRGPRERGRVVRLADGNSFGFLQDRHGQERFFHRAACIPATLFDALEVGDVVEFTPTESEKGSRAIAVRDIGNR